MEKLNKEELLVGFLYGACTWPVLSVWAVVPGLVCSVLWAIGGAGPKLYRRIGVPVVVALSIVLKTHVWLQLVMIIPLWGVCSIGYGLPEPDGSDEGSALGRFFSSFLNREAANFATRSTCFVLFVFSIGLVLGLLK